MAQKTSIEWTENTWNPITGCTKISEGCANCYACRMAQRLMKMGNQKYSNGFDVTLHENCLQDPYNWKRSRVIFVNSMSDLFHEDVPLDFIKKIFTVMNETPQHTYQILTKREHRLEEISQQLNWSRNIWMGVSVENINTVNRIDSLRKVPSYIKFISFEPLLSSVGEVDLSNIDWAIVGGESGPKARPIDEHWVWEIQKQCQTQSVLFYFKQWGGTNKKKSGRLLKGKTWDAIPAISSF